MIMMSNYAKAVLTAVKILSLVFICFSVVIMSFVVYDLFSQSVDWYPRYAIVFVVVLVIIGFGVHILAKKALSKRS